MFELKLMSGENLADQNTSKSFELILTNWLQFGRDEGNKAYVEFAEPSTGENVRKHLLGNAYVMRNGKTVSSFAYGRFDMGNSTSKEFLDVVKGTDKEDAPTPVAPNLYRVVYNNECVAEINNLPIHLKPKVVQINAGAGLKEDPLLHPPLGYVLTTFSLAEPMVLNLPEDLKGCQVSFHKAFMNANLSDNQAQDAKTSQTVSGSDSFYVFKESVYKDLLELIESKAVEG